MDIEDCDYAPPKRDLEWLVSSSPLTLPFAAVADAAEVSTAVIAAAVDRGELAAVRIGSRRRIPREAAIEYLRPLIDLHLKNATA